MPKFTATFSLHKEGGESRIPPQKFSTEGIGQSEFWNKLFELERSFGKQFGGSASHLFVTADEDIPETDIKKGEVVAYNSLEL